MKAILGLIAALVGGIALLWKKNNSLKTENKIFKDKVEDVKMETIISELEKDRKKLKVEIKTIERKEASSSLSDKDIEDFWNKGNKH